MSVIITTQQSRADALAKASKTDTIKSPTNVQETWDVILMSEDSIDLLNLMGDEAEREYRAGKTVQGGWGD